MDVLKKIKTIESFQILSESTIVELAKHCNVVEVPKNKILFQSKHQADFIYFVLYGSFKLQDGIGSKNIVIYDFVGRGDFFGMIHSVLRVPMYPFSAMANEDSAVMEVPTVEFNRLLMERPDFSGHLQTHVAQRFGEIVHDRKVSRLVVAQRMADFLLRMLNRPSLASGGRILIPLTRGDLARKLSAQEETIIRILTEWTRKGWILTVQKRIEVINVAALESTISELLPKEKASSPVVLIQGRHRLY